MLYFNETSKNMKTYVLNITYNGIIDVYLDDFLLENVPQTIEDETGAYAVFLASECCIKRESERNLSWELSRELTNEELDILKYVLETEFTEIQLNQSQYDETES